jgi:hypothetical protein
MICSLTQHRVSTIGRLLIACSVFSLLAAEWHTAEAQTNASFDVLITNGRILDGAGNPGSTAASAYAVTVS